MLDETEYAEISELHCEGLRATKEFRERWGIPLEQMKLTLSERLEPMRLRYREITGWDESNPNAILHHRLSLYGPPCRHCQKPLRTPKAKLCGSCMGPVSDERTV